MYCEAGAWYEHNTAAAAAAAAAAVTKQ